VSESGTVNAVCARCGQVIDGLVLGPGLRLADYEHMARIVDGKYAGPCGGDLIERATVERVQRWVTPDRLRRKGER
jgi:hypothetical protein